MNRRRKRRRKRRGKISVTLTLYGNMAGGISALAVKLITQRIRTEREKEEERFQRLLGSMVT